MTRGLFSTKSGGSSLFYILLVLAVGAGMKYDLEIIARVPIGEFIAFSAIPFLFRGVQFGQSLRYAKPVLAVLLLWSIAIIISDLCNGFIFLRFIRAFMKPLFCALWLLFFIGICLRNHRLILFLPIGLVFASIQNYLAPQSFTAEYIGSGGYKMMAFGVAPIILSSGLALCTVTFLKNKFLPCLVCILTAIFLVVFDAPRNNVAIQLIAALIMLYIWWSQHTGRLPKKLNLWKFCIYSGFLGLSCLAIFYLYVWAASSGFLGEYQLNKYEMQRNTIFGHSPIGLLLSGRTYVLASILSILDRPIIGYGSWTGWLMNDYYFEALTLVGTDTISVNRVLSTGAGKAGHSILFQAWMENGLLAAVSISTIGFWILRELWRTLQCRFALAPIVVLMALAFTWDFFFSPFDVGDRMAIGMILSFMVCGLSKPIPFHISDRSSYRRINQRHL